MLLLIGLLFLLCGASALIGAYLAAEFYGRFIGRVLEAARDTGTLTEEQVVEVVNLMAATQ